MQYYHLNSIYLFSKYTPDITTQRPGYNERWFVMKRTRKIRPLEIKHSSPDETRLVIGSTQTVHDVTSSSSQRGVSACKKTTTITEARFTK